MPRGACPTCAGTYTDVLEHIRKKHPKVAYTDLELQPLGLCACPDCGTACTSAHGISTHRAKVHGIAGTSRVSTMPRAKPEGVKGPLSSPVTPSPPPPRPLPPYPRIRGRRSYRLYLTRLSGRVRRRRRLASYAARTI